MHIKSKSEAQNRADQIRQFQSELKIIEQENFISLQDPQRYAITTYHEDLISQLSSTFDIDSSTREKQLSLGMKIASFLGEPSGWRPLFFFLSVLGKVLDPLVSGEFSLWGKVRSMDRICPAVGLKS